MEHAYTIVVKTGFKVGGWTNDDVFITINGQNEQAIEHNFRDFDNNAFTVGALHRFEFENAQDLGPNPTIKLRRTGGFFSVWYIDWIEIVQDGNIQSVFPVQKWIKKDRLYIVNHIDTCLPQNALRGDMRALELESIQKEYQLEVKEPGLPPQVKVLPDDEKFSCLENVNLAFDDFIYENERMKILRDGKGKPSLSGCEISWKSFKDVEHVYTDVFGVPQGSLYLNDDASFGRQRLNGLNPSLIRSCMQIPDNFNVDPGQVEPFLQNQNLEDAMRNRRLFIIDLAILSDCHTTPGCKMTCPFALFYFNQEEDLIPVAIQLYQIPAPENPVFYPSDSPNTWMLAKMWYSLADATYHQALTHLNFTHLMMEGISVASKRQLSPAHPIMKLLNPHFLYLMAIDNLALSTLINAGGFIDKCSNAGIHGHFDVMRKSMEWWRLDTHGNLKANLADRGVSVLDNVLGTAYHFRDDALLLYNAIEIYVTAYVAIYYQNPESINDDIELQAWGHEIVLSRDRGGLGMQGVPNEGVFQNTIQIVETLTPIIYTCSVGHAAANFQQYDEYASPFNYPYALSGVPPTDTTTKVTEKQILGTIASKAQLLELMTITKILSQKSTNSLGYFEEKLIVDPPAVAVVEDFRRSLERIGEQIDERNRIRNHPYYWLHPKAIPNAISI